VSSHFRARRRALSIATRTTNCVRRDSPTRARARFSKSLFKGPRSFRSERLSSCRAAITLFARSTCRRESLSRLRRVFRALPAMEWIPMHGCDPAYRFRVPLGHPAIAPRCRVNGRGVQNGETARASRDPRPDLVFRSVRSHRFVKSPIRDTCDQRLPPTLPILAPTLRTVIECVQVSLALSMHHAFSRRATRFRGSTRFTQRRFLPKVKRCFPPARPRMVESFHRAHF
jgi:hypothetical protein